MFNYLMQLFGIKQILKSVQIKNPTGSVIAILICALALIFSSTNSFAISGANNINTKSKSKYRLTKVAAASIGALAIGGIVAALLLSKDDSNNNNSRSPSLSIIHNFSGSAPNGVNPYAPLVTDMRGNFYGTTIDGGDDNCGTIFKIDSVGNFTKLYSFSTALEDGYKPYAALTWGNDGALYGTTYSGGNDNLGTIFKINPDGKGYTILYSFTNTATSGANPYAALVKGADGNFYGTTYSGGSANLGTVFKITPTGEFTQLYSFKGRTMGANPYAGLIQGDDNNFYGTTVFGGANNLGTVFQLITDGIAPNTKLTVLHSFSDSPNSDGTTPYSSLVKGKDGKFYGTTFSGGASGFGAIFSITSKGDFLRLYSFSGSIDKDGANPYAALVQLSSDNCLYGITRVGGANKSGAIFKITTGEAPTYTKLYGFARNSTDGSQPYAALVEGGDKWLYGTTSTGGLNDLGSVFKINPLEINEEGEGYVQLHSFSGTSNNGVNPYAPLIQGADGNFYGTTYAGGVNYLGSIFNITSTGRFNLMHNFFGTPNDGAHPYAAISQGQDGDFYGTTFKGGFSNFGSIFKITSSNMFTLMHRFMGGFSDGARPYFAALIQGRDNFFHGTALAGGSHNNGVVYKMALNGEINVVYSFTKGVYPCSGLIQDKRNIFYGTTTAGGDHGLGAIFKITPDGTYTTLYSFSNTLADGSNPYAALVQGNDGNFYGTTYAGGEADLGTIFKITPNGVLRTLYHFTSTPNDGANPYAALIQAKDGNFYGTTYAGGKHNLGTIFMITPAGVFKQLYSFTYSLTDGANPYAALVQGNDGSFYGTTFIGGINNVGTVFKLTM